MVYYGHKGVAITSHGESATSEGFVYEAINGASLERLPVIFVIQDNGAEFHQRVSFFYIFQFVFIPVQGMFIRIRVGTDTDAIGLYNYRVTSGYGIFPSFGHSVHRVKHIFSITIDNFQVLETQEYL